MRSLLSRYEELKPEPELEDSLVNKQRKMLNFLLKMLQARRFAGFDKWRRATDDWREEARINGEALKIQKCFRRFSGNMATLAFQKTQLQMSRMRRKQRRIEAQQRREREREEWEMKFAREAG